MTAITPRRLLPVLAALALSAHGTADAGLRYDLDYPTIGYENTAAHNAIARLQARLDAGTETLRFEPGRGYLDALLRALKIDPSSQTLVFSKTSLQFHVINGATPRAIYFNDDTYVAWVQASDLLEITTMDRELGPVFYTLLNRNDSDAGFARETSRCLACHDTFSMTGGGVPRFLVMSSVVNANGEPVTNLIASETTDETPISERWAGWYVTGRHGEQPHLGNIFFRGPADVRNPGPLRLDNLDTLEGLFDTRPYLTDKSDIVALLVLEHQIGVQNLITRANFKSRTLLARANAVDARIWGDLSRELQHALRGMLEPLVRTMLFVGAAPMTSPIRSGSGFDAWFEAQGPRDAAGRSLRELDLGRRLFRYPLSYMVYSEGFDGLPACAKDYVYKRFRAVLTGVETSADFAHLTAVDRGALLAILNATKPQA